MIARSMASHAWVVSAPDAPWPPTPTLVSLGSALSCRMLPSSSVPVSSWPGRGVVAEPVQLHAQPDQVL